MFIAPLIDGVINALFPQPCHCCGGLVESLSLGVACRHCWEDVILFGGSEALCPKCGRLLRAFGGPASGVCHRCDAHEYDMAASCGIYEGALATNILFLKKEPHIPPKVRGLLEARVRALGLDSADVAVPVPLSRRRQRERGFNQAEVIARALRKDLGLRTEDRALLRRSDTPMHRAAMDERARASTVMKAFQVVEPRAIEGRHILLVDDVMTSGATASACARELKACGAKQVSVVTLARA